MMTAADIIRLTNECWVSRALHAAVLLRVPDALESSPISLEALSKRVNCDPQVLEPVIKLLARRGVFKFANGQVGHNDASMLLRADADGTVCDFVEWMSSEEVWNALSKLPYIVANGGSGFEAYYGSRFFDYLSENPARSDLFDRHMEGHTRGEVRAILDAVDLNPYREMADVGAGSGFLASQIAERYPAARLSVFDLPGCRFNAIKSHSIRKIHGNFFEDDLPSADLTILANVLHDWPDDDAMRILRAFRRTSRVDTCLCIIEGLTDSQEEKVEMVEIGMAVMFGGRQRSLAQLQAMLAGIEYEVFETHKCTKYASAIFARPSRPA